jgi:hypothetical protein
MTDDPSIQTVWYSLSPTSILGILNWGYWLLVIGYWLLVIGYWLLVIGYWLLVILKKAIKPIKTLPII